MKTLSQILEGVLDAGYDVDTTDVLVEQIKALADRKYKAQEMRDLFLKLIESDKDNKPSRVVSRTGTYAAFYVHDGFTIYKKNECCTLDSFADHEVILGPTEPGEINDMKPEYLFKLSDKSSKIIFDLLEYITGDDCYLD